MCLGGFRGKGKVVAPTDVVGVTAKAVVLPARARSLLLHLIVVVLEQHLGVVRVMMVEGAEEQRTNRKSSVSIMEYHTNSSTFNTDQSICVLHMT